MVPAGTGPSDAPMLVEAAPDRRNNAHLVLHPIEGLDWSSGSESQKYAKTEYELRGLQGLNVVSAAQACAMHVYRWILHSELHREMFSEYHVSYPCSFWLRFNFFWLNGVTPPWSLDQNVLCE